MYPARMKMKLPLQTKKPCNSGKLALAGKDIALQNDKAKSQFVISSMDFDDDGSRGLLSFASTAVEEEQGSNRQDTITGLIVVDDF